MAHNHEHLTKQVTTNSQNEKIYFIGFAINVIFITLELVFAFMINSVSLMSDAVHNIGDVLGLLVAFTGVLLMKIKPTREHTYGLRNASILSSFASSIFLAVSICFVISESIERIFSKNVVIQNSFDIVVISLLGVLVNGFTAYLFNKNKQNDVNEKGQYLHFLADALISLVVAVSGVIIHFTGFTKLDAIVSLVAILWVLYESLDLFKETWNLITNGVPESIDEKEVENYLLSIPTVNKVNDLHIWGISTTQTALSAHLECNIIKPDTKLIDTATKYLREHFGIDHVTIQLELPQKNHKESDI
ncbi:MAG: cation diffusion facilitator family transporter [Lactobacillaceae bacterium]|jgi:cobalt-zinc-cadmium efflux system protein|nr:cation diffusion facilitator family transporter [Lactobacillaceae bacterium]